MRAAVVIAALLMVGAGSCNRGPAPQGAATPQDYDRNLVRKNHIQDLESEIREWRVELGLKTKPTGRLISTVRAQPISSLRICEERPKTDRCDNVCNVKDAICDNAADICRIAGEIGDSWSRDKCNSAKGSCLEARERCCGCIASEPSESTQHGTGGAGPHYQWNSLTDS